MYYAERQQLAEALRRFIYHESKYDDTKKIRMLAIVKKFEDWGFSRLDDADEQNYFDELIHDAGN